VWLREKLKAGAKLQDFAVQKTVASRKVSPTKRKKRRLRLVRPMTLPSSATLAWRTTAIHGAQNGRRLHFCRLLHYLAMSVWMTHKMQPVTLATGPHDQSRT
jgi:hypothetical protein